MTWIALLRTMLVQERMRISAILFSAVALTMLMIMAVRSQAGPVPYRVRGAKGCATPMPRTWPSETLRPTADFVVVPTGSLQWMINGAVAPTLTLTRGQSYTFDLTAFTDEHPFLINGTAALPFGTIYLPQASGTTVTFTPTNAMPNTVYYHCSVHYGMVGTIHLVPTLVCAGDLNNDLVVNSTDFGLFVAAFGTACSGCKADMNADGTVNITDFGLFVGAFGQNCS